PGDSVIIPAPFWTSYPDMVRMCGASSVVLPTLAAEDYSLTGAALRQALEQQPRARVLILCNPSNPSGCVSSEQSLLEIAAVLRDFPQVVVLSDEIYERLTYEPEHPHLSFAAIPGMHGRTVTINGFSKSHSMTGYRIGYLAAPLRVAKAAAKVQSQITSCASSVSQHAALAALSMPDGGSQWLRERLGELRGKRDLAYSLLQDIPGVSCPLPRGAFYLLPDVSSHFGKRMPATAGAAGVVVRDSTDLCLQLLRAEGVALVPGDAFGAPATVRISYAASEQLLQGALTRLGRFLAALE
ncbi:pyridoxal phosphate-dependent transferase, partial [Ochromonadaceae sp. CCMP2298]